MINRFSSRTNNLGETFFKNSLENAVNYDRIAGYFSSSIIEIAGEYIDKMQGKVRIICNSQLQIDDVKFIKDQPQAMKLEWCDGKPEEELAKIPERLIRLYQYLVTDKMEVRVLPNDVFGLIHGFGFASALSDLTSGTDAQLLALVGFNLGVETGQLAIVAIFIPLAFLSRNSQYYQRGILTGGSLMIASVAGLWLCQRLFNLTF